MSTLRIVGGALGGRRFSGPRKGEVRPTSERVREAVASALEARDAIEGALVLDLFAGTGALAFEALSRGARAATLVEGDHRVARALDRAARQLGLAERTRVRRVDLLGARDRIARALSTDGPFTLVFADPPYAEIDRLPALLGALIESAVIAPGARVVVEHAARGADPSLPLASIARYRYGDTAIALGEAPRPGQEKSTP
ncbi:MAG: RsmD family RNA methyltransferase [Myxococcota bacterium]